MINKIIIDLARDSIKSKFTGVSAFDKEELLSQFPSFNKTSATFVTLTIDGVLRGCVGSLVGHRKLYDDIVSNGLNAAFNDHRFKPLTYEELGLVKIEVSILSEAKELIYTDFNDLKTKIVPLKHGVILRLDNHQATFLPQVWEQLPTFETFMLHLYNKAGLNLKTTTSLPHIYLYTVEKIEE